MYTAFKCKFCAEPFVTYAEAYRHTRKGDPHRTVRVQVDAKEFTLMSRREAVRVSDREREQLRLRATWDEPPADGQRTQEL